MAKSKKEQGDREQAEQEANKVLDRALQDVKVADDATVIAPLVLSGIVKTDKGFALAVATLSPEGKVVDVKIGHSQSEKQFVAIQLKKHILSSVGKV